MSEVGGGLHIATTRQSANSRRPFLVISLAEADVLADDGVLPAALADACESARVSISMRRTASHPILSVSATAARRAGAEEGRNLAIANDASAYNTGCSSTVQGYLAAAARR